ncbi:hypothetical protein ACWDRB_47675 [Nonomuraea sp. NPDC003707]
MRITAEISAEPTDDQLDRFLNALTEAAGDLLHLGPGQFHMTISRAQPMTAAQAAHAARQDAIAHASWTGC